MAMAYSGQFNMDKLKQSLFRKEQFAEGAVKEAVEAGAKLIEEEAKINAPVDTHNLESAIHISERRTRSGNYAVDIECSGIGDDGRDVAEYAMEIHEHYQSYHPGEGTLEKRAEYPDHYVGEKFMERAVTAKKQEAIDLVRAAVKEAMSK
jgi:hypothetical protein